MAKFGIPYMGSKGGIAEHIIAQLPEAENFYDLFGGGFSITHCALLSKKWKNYHFNEINSDLVTLIKDAISGKYNYEVFKPKFISSEEFKQNLNDPYVRVCWSFGNNQKDYLFNKEIEPYKKSMHNAVIFGEFDETAKKVFGFDKWNGETIKERRFILRSVVKKDIGGEPRQLQRLERLQQLERLQRLQQLQQLQQLERLQQLEQLERLERLQQLELTSMDYRKVQVKPNSIIYCDPPYQGTASYLGEFNHADFYKWVVDNPNPVYFSEYNCDKIEGIYLINAKSKMSRLSASETARKNKTEKLFTNEAGLVLHK